jgi:hypothetical protein
LEELTLEKRIVDDKSLFYLTSGALNNKIIKLTKGEIK